MLSEQLTNEKSSSENGNSERSQTEEAADPDQAEIVRQLPREAQKQVAPFDENDGYGALTGHFVSTSQKRSAHGREKIQRYNDKEVENVEAAFEEVFCIWPKSTSSTY